MRKQSKLVKLQAIDAEGNHHTILVDVDRIETLDRSKLVYGGVK